MHRLKTLALVFAAALLSFMGLVGTAQAQDALARARAVGVLQIGTEEQFPPYDFIQDGKHVGFNVDLFDAVSKKLGLKLEWIDLPWASVLPGLQSKKYDVVAGPASITAERQKAFRFLPPISVSQSMIQVRKGEKAIAKPEDIAGKKIGVQRAASALYDTRKLSATLPRPVEIIEYVDNTQANADLEAGRLDGVANSDTNVLDAVKQRPDIYAAVLPPFGAKTYAGYMLRKDNDSKSLFDAVSAALLAVKKDGTLTALQTKWFGRSVEVPDAAPDL